MANKISYVSVLTKVLNGEALSAEELSKVEALRDQMAKRNSAKSGKPTKAQLANAEIASAVLEAMEIGVSYDVSAIKGLVPALAEATPQKIGPMMKKLADAGSVEVAKAKGKNFYTRVGE